MKLVKFAEAGGKGNDVYVNPELVAYVRSYNADMTTINFPSKDQYVVVKGDLATVTSALFNAGKP